MITEEITKDITDRKWRHLKWTECAGLGWWENMAKVIFPEGIEAKLRTLTALDIRDDDVMICTFPKAGTHWIWEIVSMVTKGVAEYETKPKISLMIEIQPSEKINSAPSPRILNSHFNISCLPVQVFTKQIKIIHVMRNPKDIAVSFYHHMKQLKYYDETWFETFSEFLPYLTGDYGVYLYESMFDYFKEMIQFSTQNPTLVLNLHFEEMKKNPVDAVRKVATFLNKDLSDDVIYDIADKCSFQKLKHAEETFKQQEDISSRITVEQLDTMKKQGPIKIHRKGEVGDWKNHFTVAESEQFDKLLEEQFRDCEIKFIYS